MSYVGVNLGEVLRKCFGDFDSFWYLSDERELEMITRYVPPTRLLIEHDMPIETKNFPARYDLKTGLQAFLQQIHGWKRSNDMRKQYQLQSGTKYDLVVRCRPDILFRKHLLQLDQIDTSVVTVPAFGSWMGYNDRFAIGNPGHMDTLMNFFQFVCANPACIEGLNAESIFKNYLESQNVPVSESPFIGFDRVRYHSGNYIIQRDC